MSNWATAVAYIKLFVYVHILITSAFLVFCCVMCDHFDITKSMHVATDALEKTVMAEQLYKILVI